MTKKKATPKLWAIMHGGACRVICSYTKKAATAFFQKRYQGVKASDLYRYPGPESGLSPIETIQQRD